MPQSPTAPESLEPSDTQINEFLSDFCGKWFWFVNDMNAIALVRLRMSDNQQREFLKRLCQQVLNYRPGKKFIGQVEELIRVFNAPASLRARIAYDVLRADVPDEKPDKLDLAREDLEHLETRETLGLPPARRL